MDEPILTPELYVSDIDKSLRFYIDILGFAVLYAREEEKFAMLNREGAWIMLEQPGSGRSWITDTLEKPYGRGVNFQIMVSNVSDLYTTVQESGLSPFLELEEKWYETDIGKTGNKQFIVQDPDGYLLRFFEDLGLKK